MTSHLGRNPVKGGSPPKDNNKRTRIIKCRKFLDSNDENSFEELTFIKYKNINKVIDVIA